MPISSNDTREIEAYLLQKQAPDESILFRYKLMLQPNLADALKWQEKTYRLVQRYGRKQLKAEIAQAEQMVFNDSSYQSFRNKILRLFKR